MPTPRGIDHVGITVPDLDEAVEFFVEALGCELVYANQSAGCADQALGAASGSKVEGIRFLRCANGANIELFAFAGARQRRRFPCASDYAIQHVAFYVDDLDAAVERAGAAGAQLLSAPRCLPDREAGPGNRFVYGRAPWGLTFELITYPSPMPYEDQADLRRWTPPRRPRDADVTLNGAAASRG